MERRFDSFRTWLHAVWISCENSVSLFIYLYSVAHCDAFSVRVAEYDDARVAYSRHP